MNFGTGPLTSCDPVLNSLDYPYLATVVGYPY